MLNSIQSLKGYRNANFTVFFNIKRIDNNKKIIYMIDFLCQIEILLLNMKKLFKNRGFYQVF